MIRRARTAAEALVNARHIVGDVVNSAPLLPEKGSRIWGHVATTDAIGVNHPIMFRADWKRWRRKICPTGWNRLAAVLLETWVHQKIAGSRWPGAKREGYGNGQQNEISPESPSLVGGLRERSVHLCGNHSNCHKQRFSCGFPRIIDRAQDTRSHRYTNCLAVHRSVPGNFLAQQSEG